MKRINKVNDFFFWDHLSDFLSFPDVVISLACLYLGKLLSKPHCPTVAWNPVFKLSLLNRDTWKHNCVLIIFKKNSYLCIYIIMNGYIKLEITMTRKSGTRLHVTYRALNSCFDLIRSHQQCTPWSPPLDIEPQYAEAETLPLCHWFMPCIIDTKSTSYSNRDHLT